MTQKKALIAMSGGVDSSVTAYLMQQQGYDCTGAMMKLYEVDETQTVCRQNTCCSLADAQDARQVAARLQMPFYVFQYTEAFEAAVIDRFVSFYERGMTPNPCIDCNRFLKFDAFLQRAEQLGNDAIATGHYARIQFDKGSGRHLLLCGKDMGKDQSYVLYAMTQAQLAKTKLPLGALEKNEVREIAEAQGFRNARKRDSQDLCFVPDGDYAAYIAQKTGKPAVQGVFVDQNGTVVGTHRGITHYTIGQRRGLGLAMQEPTYVCSIDVQKNEVKIGRVEDLLANTLTAQDINLIATPCIEGKLRVQAKVRYRQTAQPATVWQTGEDALTLRFDLPQRAITCGQAVVLYDGDVVIGGGTIASVGEA